MLTAVAKHKHGWRHWQRACPRCRQRRRSAFVAVGTALVTGALLSFSFVPAAGSTRQPVHTAAIVAPAQASLPVGDPGSLYQLATATRLTASETTTLTASQTAAVIAHKRHLAHLAHVRYLARLRAARAAARVTGSSLSARLLAEAETRQGTPYVYGGDSPGGFDCSGLIYWAARQLGITAMPRDTFGMLAAAGGVLVPVSRPQPGDLAFFGSGHVELYVSPGRFFGAQQTGTLVGLHDYGGFYLPTAYYAVR